MGFGGDTLTHWEVFSLPPVHNVLRERMIEVAVARLPGGVSGVRVAGEAIWHTPRTSWGRIPAGVRRVAFTARGVDARRRLGRLSESGTLTGTRVRRLVSFFNAADVAQPGRPSCSDAVIESAVSLRFIGAGGRTLARAAESPTGCGSVGLTIGGRTGPALSDEPNVTDELVGLGAVPICAGGALPYE